MISNDSAITMEEQGVQAVSVRIDDGDDMLTPDKVAELLHVSRKTIIGWARAGRLRSVSLGRLIRFNRDDIAHVKKNGLLPVTTACSTFPSRIHRVAAGTSKGAWEL